MTRFAIVAIIRNQAPYIVEWMAHHLALGFEDFVLCIYGCSDGTARVTRRLAAMGYARHHKITVEDEDPTGSALKQIADFEEITGADWVALGSIDRFLNIHRGHGGLSDLVSDCLAETDALLIEDRVFGSNGVDVLNGNRVTDQFTQRSVQPETSGPGVRIARALSALGAPQAPVVITPDTAQSNWYACRSRDDLAARLATPGSQEPADILSQWRKNDLNDEMDTTIRRYDTWFEKYRKHLISDRRLRLAQAAGLNWHKERAEAARTDPALAEMIASLGGR